MILDTSKYLKLENITNKFQVPCVMDIKMGRVTWDDNADETFRERRRKKWPLKEVTGFSILGFMVYFNDYMSMNYLTQGKVSNFLSVTFLLKKKFLHTSC